MLCNVLSFLLIQAVFALLARADLYLTSPLPDTTCTGGKTCTVNWVDDGVQPLIPVIGPCYVALYNGNMRLIQQIEPVDVSSQHSLDFTPDPNSGPDSVG
ncbi:uncharacterized protein BXZ73DRAFT_48269 [Epithele typhae]|uniref:uncharacterized protein n=1 Tax=Epithele typhae TaxID=378194 RepID=UPI0020082695|nr:uncharacterized protein BXZ73DRAFT_48269 [Epithele typhae]KAH9929047.1 hypothetical protein BXZ73DRAFT_48269 [Epithele typhae]